MITLYKDGITRKTESPKVAEELKRAGYAVLTNEPEQDSNAKEEKKVAKKEGE